MTKRIVIHMKIKIHEEPKISPEESADKLIRFLKVLAHGKKERAGK